MTTVYTTTHPTGTRTEMRLSVLRSPAHTIVNLRGDINGATAPALRQRLLSMLRPGMSLLALDLSMVRSCDTAGAAVLIGTQRRARALGIAIRLAAPTFRVVKVLHVTGLDRHLTIHPTLSAALARPLPRPLAHAPARNGTRGVRPAPRTGSADPDRTREAAGDLGHVEIVAAR
jgi:anti-sigma B factor antagonist